MSEEESCVTCGQDHPIVTHDEDCERWHGSPGSEEIGECICGDNVMGTNGYVSVRVDCIDEATE